MQLPNITINCLIQGKRIALSNDGAEIGIFVQ